MPYNHKAIEKKWQKRWEKEDAFVVTDKVKKEKKKYILDMFPYPSGAGLHVGHPEGYTATDIYARYLRMKGYQVLHPMGWDAFGLPAENYAIKSGIHPKESTEQNIKTFTRQIKSLGFSYDWSREVSTSSPDYYKWTQWLFLQLYSAGLAYKKAAPVNWCNDCQTVLANEQVVDGKCERCGTVVIQKNLEQWFFRITGDNPSFKFQVSSFKTKEKMSYPERLLNNLDKLDWPEPIKIMQRNWIGKSEGAELDFPVVIPAQAGIQKKIKVFTTRPDTLYGATYMVLAPEHQLVQELKDSIENWSEVEKYIKKSAAKTQLERTDLAKEKTGVELKGVRTVNPATGEQIPIWIADYVLATYGTGAIMAVPGHDQRDFEFAKKFGLEIKNVVDPVTGSEQKDPKIKRKIVAAVVDGDNILSINWGNLGGRLLIGGTIETDEDPMPAATREITEETGYTDLELIEIGQETIHHEYFAHSKNTAFYAYTRPLYFRLKSRNNIAKKLEDNEKGKFSVEWISKKQAEREITDPLHRYVFDKFILGHCYDGAGIMANSGEFDGMDSQEAKWKITKKVGGKRTVQYKLRDWLISRQRYWGAPIPVIYCDECGEQPVPEKDLPVELPDDVDFRPKGESPLARSKSFHKVKCPKCDKPARRESDTMDTFVDSSWYFLRYADPKNKKEFADKNKIKAWLPVDTYVGGAEHAVLHLMYARFITMALHDLGYVDFQEPFLRLRNQGLILGPDGQKMSKSRGNVINPDEVIEKLGADTMRMYEMFMGPLEDAKPWDTNGIIGVRRFLDRVFESYKLQVTSYKTEESKNIVTRELHRLIKKVGDDIQSFDFNTAVSQFMIFMNAVYKVGEISKEHLETFLQVLSPFAPHIANELWEQLGHKKLIEHEEWPKYNPRLIQDKEVVFIVQINGKVRGQIMAGPEASEKEVALIAKKDEKVKGYLEDVQVVKQVFVKGKLINFVIKS